MTFKEKRFNFRQSVNQQYHKSGGDVKKTLIILSVLIIVLFLSGKAYFYYSLPEYEGEIQISGLTDTVEVFTDEFGVPHIFAKNEKDLFYTAGYVTARERLFQMTATAAAGRGELSLLFGDDMLSSDIYLRNWGIPEMGRQIFEKADQEILEILEVFCDGINARIDEVGSALPPEFKILGIKPIRWTPADVYGYGRLMARELQQSWKPEILYGSVLEYFGPEKTAELLPPDDPTRHTIALLDDYKDYAELLKGIYDEEKTIRTLTGTNTPFVGSNNWVLAGKRTTTGKPILANDPHLGYTQPAKWFEMHLSGGRFEVSGVFLPGVPVPVIGQNAACAWGYTNVMADDMDFFIETVRDGKYLHGGEWKDLTYREETIPLKNGKDTTVVLASTHHGPIIYGGVHPLVNTEEKAISVAWTGNVYSDEMSAMLGLSLMSNWEDFTEAVKQFAVPGQNMVYADTAGNIGWRPAVRIPLRKDGNSLVPRPGDDPGYDWAGYIPFNEMPYLYNPDEGYIATANNKTIDDSYPHYISNLWCDHSRIQRIHELIGTDRVFSVDNIKTLQTDVLSPYSREMMPYLLESLEKTTLNELEKKALKALTNWDFTHPIHSAGALVFNVTVNRLIHLTYSDELQLLGDRHFAALVDITDLPFRTILAAVKADSYSWFDDITTKEYRETGGDMIEKAFKEAVQLISERSGNHTENWRWGEFHTLTHPHDMGGVRILDMIFNFNVGPFESPGSPNTVNDGGFSLDQPFTHSGGPSMRRIVNLGAINETQMILPSGNSGLPKSRHYGDQAPLYNEGKYKTTVTDEHVIRASSNMRKLVLIPES